ncbi:hypothetical protein BKA07_001124 [Brevibacterium marinum]|uniref:Uncharacterized protein n=1 Tax=Brevibacterium marinum TaxID=418643 RepID=A0A846RQQ0_9MICO|nr:hypothetical protein [Brevibacterium marinum]
MSPGPSPCNSINYTHRIRSSSNSVRVLFATSATPAKWGRILPDGRLQPRPDGYAAVSACAEFFHRRAAMKDRTPRTT